MKRREVLQALTGTKPLHASKGIGKRPVISSLEQETSPLDKAKAYHLLRRLTFAPTVDMLNLLIGQTPQAAVQLLIGNGSDPTVPSADWATKAEENPLSTGSTEIRYEIEGRMKGYYSEFINWWINQMQNDAVPSREKITLFWSTVWCIEFTFDVLSLLPVPLLLKNNQKLRSHFKGNYKEMAKAITLDGAMLLYQSLHYSSKEKANENYMRELMELFTMGIGNYTEGDIKEGSRALTGWRTAAYFGEPFPNGYFETYFLPTAHDTSAKTFMGHTIPARDEADNTEDQVREEEVYGIIDIMFNRKAEAISKFIANKIYRYFVYSNPGSNDSAIVGELAQVLRDNNFDLMPVFTALFTSKHFYDEANIGVQIKTPPEFIIGLQKQIGKTYSTSRAAIFELDQELYDPPNVGSWKAYRTWESTRTYPLRKKYAYDILELLTNTEWVEFAKKFEGYSSANQCVANIVEYFFPKSIDSSRQSYYLALMLQEAQATSETWTQLIEADNSNVGIGIRALIQELALAPEFQLS